MSGLAHRRARNARWLPWLAATLVGTPCPAALGDTPAGLSLVMQSDAAYDVPTAQRLAEAAPRDLVFRVMGPLTPNSMSSSDIVNFVGGLGTWAGRLWFNVDATKSAFDQGYWGTQYAASDAYKAYVDYFDVVRQALVTAGKRSFDGIFLECENSYLLKSGSFLGHQGLVGQYLASKSLADALIGTTGSYKQASSFAELGVDLLPIQAYNFDGGDPAGFSNPSPAAAASLAAAISGTLAANYVADPGSLTTPGVVVMFSYEPQFFGALGTGSTAWTAPLFGDFLTDFRQDLATAGVSGSAAIGVYDVGTATTAWDGLLLPEPGGWFAALAGVACVARVARRSWRSLPAVVALLAAVAGPAPGAWAIEGPAVESWLADHLDAAVALYTDLHQAPELSLAEEQTAARVATELKALGADVTTGVGGHGVVGVLRSPDGRGPVLMVRADMDALPIVEQTGLPYASSVRVKDDRGTTVGVMHACGHDVHVAALVGGLRCLVTRPDRWSGTILAVFQPAEEKGGGARSMLADGLFARFPRPAAAVALHCAADRATGTVACKGGPINANVDSVDITIRGRGGHGAYPHTTVDPILVASRLVVDLQSLVSREIDPVQPAVVTVGSIHGGTKHNVIPDDCHLQLTVRSFTPEVRARLLDGIRRKALAAAAAAGAPEPDVVSSKETTPAVVNDPQVSDRVAAALRRALGDDRVQPDVATMGGEDFSLYGGAGVPSCMFRLGTVPAERLAEFTARGESPPSLHSPRYAPEPRGTLAAGVAAWVAVVEEFLDPPAAASPPPAASRE